MSAEQQRLFLAVVTAINEGRDLYKAAAAVMAPEPEPARHEMNALIRILRLPDVGFRHGHDPAVVLARILDLLEAHIEGDAQDGASAVCEIAE